MGIDLKLRGIYHQGMEEDRLNKIKKFMKLDPEQQLLWSLKQGYLLWELVPKKERKILRKLRNAKRNNS